MTRHQNPILCLCADCNASRWQRADEKCCMNRWYLEGPASLYLFVGERLAWKTFCWLVLRVREDESEEGDTLIQHRGAGAIHGAAGLAESLEARGHPSAASRADHTLLLPRRPQDVWQGQGTDGVCVCVVMLSQTWLLDMSRARYVNVSVRGSSLLMRLLMFYIWTYAPHHYVHWLPCKTNFIIRSSNMKYRLSYD